MTRIRWQPVPQAAKWNDFLLIFSIHLPSKAQIQTTSFSDSTKGESQIWGEEHNLFWTRKDASASKIFHYDIIALVHNKLLRSLICTIYLKNQTWPTDVCMTACTPWSEKWSCNGLHFARSLCKCSGADKGIEVMQVGWKKSSESSGGELLPIG